MNNHIGEYGCRKAGYVNFDGVLARNQRPGDKIPLPVGRDSDRAAGTLLGDCYYGVLQAIARLILHRAFDGTGGLLCICRDDGEKDCHEK